MTKNEQATTHETTLVSALNVHGERRWRWRCSCGQESQIWWDKDEAEKFAAAHRDGRTAEPRGWGRS